jgi:hypothetical protein
LAVACINYAKNYRNIEKNKISSQNNDSHSQEFSEESMIKFIYNAVTSCPEKYQETVDSQLHIEECNEQEKCRYNKIAKKMKWLFDGVDEIINNKGNFEIKLQTLMKKDELSDVDQKNFKKWAKSYYESKTNKR